MCMYFKKNGVSLIPIVSIIPTTSMIIKYIPQYLGQNKLVVMVGVGGKCEELTGVS